MSLPPEYSAACRSEKASNQKKEVDILLCVGLDEVARRNYAGQFVVANDG